MKTMYDNTELRLHLLTARMLLDGISESVERNSGRPYEVPEYSRESIKRRCIQARQELLRVMQEVDNT